MLEPLPPQAAKPSDNAATKTVQQIGVRSVFIMYSPGDRSPAWLVVPQYGQARPQ